MLDHLLKKRLPKVFGLQVNSGTMIFDNLTNDITLQQTHLTVRSPRLLKNQFYYLPLCSLCPLFII